MLKTAPTSVTVSAPPASSVASSMCLVMTLGMLVGCGDPPLAKPTDTASADVQEGFDSTFAGSDIGAGSADASAATDAQLNDTLGRVQADGNATSTGDSHNSADTASGPEDSPIWTKPDIDSSTLKVIGTTPAMGALGVDRKFTFKLTFSAPVIDAGIQDYTVLVADPTGAPVAGSFVVKGAEVTFTADKPAVPSSRISVNVTTIVQGTQGQTMDAPFAYHFHTRGYGNDKPWADLARRYAPVIRLGVSSNSPSWPAKERLAFDPSFDFSTVGYTVSATRSHYFVTYIFRRPARPNNGAKPGFSHDLSGATVVLRRYPVEKPVGLFTWFMDGGDEQWWGWLTKEGGLLPAGYNAKKSLVRAVVAESSLFPVSSDNVGVVPGKSQSPRRYTALHTAKTHQSCWWPDLGEVQYKQCETHKGAKLAMNLVELVPFPTADKPPFVPKAADAKLTSVNYALSPFDELLWPRRDDTTLFSTPLTFTYKPPSGRPQGLKHPVGSKYVSTTKGFGRPPWAWRWKPATNSTYYELPRGTLFMDPAWAIYQRLGGKTAKIAPFDKAKKSGFSLDYCFAPQLFVDQRDSADCKEINPPG